jgi:hypothetical protein
MKIIYVSSLVLILLSSNNYCAAEKPALMGTYYQPYHQFIKDIFDTLRRQADSTESVEILEKILKEKTGLLEHSRIGQRLIASEQEKNTLCKQELLKKEEEENGYVFCSDQEYEE